MTEEDLNAKITAKELGLAPARMKKKTWMDSLDDRMMRLKYSDESMIHFRKSKNYLNIAKMQFKDTSDCVNGVFEVDENEIEQEAL
jgi:hypothetical protein